MDRLRICFESPTLKILISYRRADGKGIVGRIFDRLVARYGAESVFLDIDSIPFGVDFRNYLKAEVEGSDVVLAIIGPRWLGTEGRSISDEGDFVRIEIELALRSVKAIIPVLIDGASMPQPNDLPDTLKEFAFRNAARVESGRDFHSHLNRLIKAIDFATEDRTVAKAQGDRVDAAGAPIDVAVSANKPSVAVLPFANLSGDSSQDYFADGVVEDIIAAMSHMRWLLMISRNSSFTYKNSPIDPAQIAQELNVRYVVRGSVRKSGNRVRVTAQLIDASAGKHLWGDHFDGVLDDLFAMQEEVVRAIVGALAPQVEVAEMARARRREFSSGDAIQLAWRAQALFYDAIQRGQSALMLNAIDMAKKAIASDSTSLLAHSILNASYLMCHLYRWGPDPDQALDLAWSTIEKMMVIDALDDRTLTQSGLTRVMRGENDRGVADLRRAIEVNPNSDKALRALALGEAAAGLSEEAKSHALLYLRLSPRDNKWMGVAQLALAMANYTERNYEDALRWAEQSIQSQPSAPIRRAIMIACYARAGHLREAARERKSLDGFAPDFVPSLFRGENRVFTQPNHMQDLLDGLRLAGD